jgi:ERCC4-type nuclease
MSLIITPGEKALLEEFEKKDITVNIENLLIGDIHLKNKNGELLYIFERKAKTDLDASIKDGRYREQKTRLFATNLPRKNIIYIIENLTLPRDIPGQKRIWSAICNMQHRDGFTVFQTINTAQTATFLLGMLASVEQFEPSETVAKDLVPTVNIKKASVEKGQLLKYTLMLIPRVSEGIANSILENYSSFEELKTALEDPFILADIRFGASNRRIGKILSNDICEHFLNF